MYIVKMLDGVSIEIDEETLNRLVDTGNNTKSILFKVNDDLIINLNRVVSVAPTN